MGSNIDKQGLPVHLQLVDNPAVPGREASLGLKTSLQPSLAVELYHPRLRPPGSVVLPAIGEAVTCPPVTPSSTHPRASNQCSRFPRKDRKHVIHIGYRLYIQKPEAPDSKLSYKNKNRVYKRWQLYPAPEPAPTVVVSTRQDNLKDFKTDVLAALEEHSAFVPRLVRDKENSSPGVIRWQASVVNGGTFAIRNRRELRTHEDFVEFGHACTVSAGRKISLVLSMRNPDVELAAQALEDAYAAGGEGASCQNSQVADLRQGKNREVEKVAEFLRIHQSRTSYGPESGVFLNRADPRQHVPLSFKVAANWARTLLENKHNPTRTPGLVSSSQGLVKGFSESSRRTTTVVPTPAPIRLANLPILSMAEFLKGAKIPQDDSETLEVIAAKKIYHWTNFVDATVEELQGLGLQWGPAKAIVHHTTYLMRVASAGGS